MSYPSISMCVLKQALSCGEITLTTPVSSTSTQIIPPYATMLGFTRYVARTGPAKATFVGGLRRQRERRSGFNPHGQLVKALKADIAFRTGGSYLNAVVDLVKPRWKPLYEAVSAGATTYLHSLGDPEGVGLAQTRDALASVWSASPRPATPWPRSARWPSRSIPTSACATRTAGARRSGCTSTSCRPRRRRSPRPCT